MEEPSKRYRAFVSYSQRDGAAARRLHRALERYRVPKGIEARVGSDRSLGRFFRDDDEMGASQSLGAALEGALDDSEALIVVCSPSAARSNWVDAEIRHFKARVDARVLPVIADGEPHARDPDRECFPPALKVKIGPDGEPTGEADEPRAPDLRREGLRRVRCQLAAGLLGLPFDDLWRRDRRRARQVRLAIGAVALVVVAVLGIAGLGWLGAQSEARTRAATQALARARVASADGRLGEALTGLAPFLDTRETRALVEPPLRALLGWVTDPEARLAGEGLQPVRLRDATALLDPARGVYDVSDAGLQLRRLIRSRDGERLVVVGDQRVIVFGAKSGQRLAESENGRVEWIGHALEAPSELLVVTGAILGPTNGSVSPWALAISADGTRVERHQIPAHMFWGSAAGVAPECAALLVATEENDGSWQVERRAFDATGLRSPVPELDVAPGRRGDSAGIDALSRLGSGFATQAAFMGEAEQNPFALAGCATPAVDDGFALGGSDSPGPRVVSLDLGLSFEPAESWEPGPTRGDGPSPPPTYLPDCTEARPCPIVGGRVDTSFVRDSSTAFFDRIGPPPLPRWSRSAGSDAADAPIYFEHRIFNSGHSLVLCRVIDGADACFQSTPMGEDHLELPFLRSPDGRYLFWPFAGTIVDLETLKPVAPDRVVPRTPGNHFDFEIDGPGLTLAFEGRLVSFVPGSAGDDWLRTDDARASARFGLLAADEGPQGEPPLHTLASLGDRHYLVVREDGVLARLDARASAEVWRVNAGDLGGIRDVQLDPERRHALIAGDRAWRLFRLEDGFAASALLAPPPALGEPAESKPVESMECQLEGALGPRGELVASCRGQRFAWRPREYEGRIEPRLAQLTCAVDVSESALETIRRCYVAR